MPRSLDSPDGGQRTGVLSGEAPVYGGAGFIAFGLKRFYPSSQRCFIAYPTLQSLTACNDAYPTVLLNFPKSLLHSHLPS